jgi:hypothetical protein
MLLIVRGWEGAGEDRVQAALAVKMTFNESFQRGSHWPWSASGRAIIADQGMLSSSLGLNRVHDHRPSDKAHCV